MSDEIAFAGAARMAAMVRDGEVSPTELVELHLERIERLDPRLNAFRVVLAERARAEAKQAEARRGAGDDRPLLGVPVALKDGHDLAGEVSTHGTDCFEEPEREDAEMVRRLRAAGAIVIGKTNLPELAIHGFTESATWGVTRNPWDQQRAPGGSSGGSAAAVASGMVPLASASDGAGSIRIPSAACGVFGLKPQRGRVPIAPDHYAPRGEHWHGMSMNGCVSRTVADTALFLDVAGGDSPEEGAPGPPDRPFAEAAATPPGKLRIAWTVTPPRLITPAPPVDAEVVRVVEETAELLASLGHAVERREPEWGNVGANVMVRYLRGIGDDVKMTPHRERLERRTRGYARLAAPYTDGLLARARAAEASDAERIGAIFRDHDVLMTPVAAGPPLKVRAFEGRGAILTVLGSSRRYPFTVVWNHLGNPAASVPAGFDSRGLPLAVQLVGRPADEGTLLSLSAQLEAERPWADARPPGG